MNRVDFLRQSQRLLLWAIFLLLPCYATAGMTGAEWVIVVNGDSIPSRTIANHYVALREIPDRNVIVLDRIPDSESIGAPAFLRFILEPVLQEISQRGLANHIQGIAYSADFPTSITFKPWVKDSEKLPAHVKPAMSITGATFLYQFSLAKSPGISSLETNYFARSDCEKLFRSPVLTTDWEPWNKYRDATDEASKAEALQGIINEFPTHASFRYMLARHLAKIDEKEQAIGRIREAIALGWSFRQELVDEPDFQSLGDSAEFQIIRDTCPDLPFDYMPVRGFEARVGYAANHLPASTSKGMRYLLSTVLAVTRGAGLSLAESIANLERSASADNTHPDAQVVFTTTNDVRTTTRSPNFGVAIRELEKLGLRTKLVTDRVPIGENQVIGLTLGAPKFSLPPDSNGILPGAILENLTSFGGIMSQVSGQTKLSEFLRAGAAASSGTVIEPFALQQKFPHPMIHHSYASGLSLAEAFYSSLESPYQLLIVGDPLCQPFAKPPVIRAGTNTEIDGPMMLSPGEPLQFDLIRPDDDGPKSDPALFQVLVDGVLKQRGPPKRRVNFDLKNAPPGAHELTIVAIDASKMQHKFQLQTQFAIADATGELPLRLSVTQSDGRQAILHVAANSSVSEIRLCQHHQPVVKQVSSNSDIDLAHSAVGGGPVRLYLEGKLDGIIVRSPAIVVEFDSIAE